MRSWIAVLMLAMILVVAAACGDDQDDDAPPAADPTPTEEAAPTPTPEPEPEPTPTEEPETTPTPEPTPEPDATDDADEPGETRDTAGLTRLLLTVDEMPADWTAMEYDDESIGDFEDATTDDPFEAPCGIEPSEDLDSLAEVSREFQKTEFGPYFNQTISMFASSSDAERAMDLLREWFGCDEWTEMDEFGDEMTFVITEVDFTDFGDDTFALNMTFSLGEDDEENPMLDLFGDIALDLIFVRRGEYISYFMYFDIFGMDPTSVEDLIQLADDKIAREG